MSRVMSEAGVPAQRVSGFLGDMGTNIAITAAGFVSAQAVLGAAGTAFRTLSGFVQESAKAFADADASQIKLAAALRAQGSLTPTVVGSLNAMASALQNTTVHSDDTINSMQALLAEIGGVMPYAMKGALQASADLAAGLGIDLDTATRLVAKAAAGHTETLGKYGVIVDQAALKTKGFDAVLGAINQKFGGQAAAEVETYSGKVKQLENSWNNFQEAVGKFVLLNPFTTAALRSLTEAAATLDTKSGQASFSVAGLVHALNLPIDSTIIAFLEAYLTKNNELAESTARLTRLRQDMNLVPSHMTEDEKQQRALEAATRATREAAERHVKALKDQQEAAKAAAAEFKRFTDSVTNATVAANLSVFTLNRFGAVTLPNIESGFHGITKELPPLATGIRGVTVAGDRLKAVVVPMFSTLPNIIAGNTEKLKGTTQATVELSGNLGTLANDFVQMAQIAGDSWGGPLRTIGETIKAVDMVGKGIQQIGTAMASVTKDGFSAANLSSLASEWLGVATAVYSMAVALDNAEKAALLLREKSEFAKNLAAYYGSATLFSEGLTESLFHMSKVLGPTIEQGLRVNDVVKELGGWSHLTAGELKAVEKSLYEVSAGFEKTNATGQVVFSIFQTIALGGPVGAKAIGVLDEALVGMGEAALSSGGFVSQFFQDMVARAKVAGVELDGVNDFLVGQLGVAATGLNALLGGLQASATASAQAQAKALGKLTDEEIRKIVGSFRVTAEQGAGLAAAVLGNFAEMIDRGASFRDALDSLQPSIEALSSALASSGVDGGAAFGLLTDMSRIAHDAILGPLTDALAGADKALKGLHNSGILNQSMFTGLEQTAVDAYNKIIAGGGSAAAANMLISPTLQDLWSLQQEFGYAVDETTQALIDQAVADGTVGEKHKPIAEQMLDATTKIVDAVEGLAKVFGVTLPDQAAKGAGRVNDELKKIKTPSIPPPWADWGEPPIIAGNGSTPARSEFAQASFVRSGGAAVLPFTARAGAGGGTLTTTVILDGRAVASAVAKVLPSELRRMGWL